MRVLVIIPGLNKKYNDNAFSYLYMHNLGIKLNVITCRSRSTKGPGLDSLYENMDGIQVHRIYNDFREQTSFPSKKYRQVYKIVNEFQPNLIFCSQQRNMRLALKLKKDFNLPILLLVEFAYNPDNPFRLIGKQKIIRNNFLGKTIAKGYWMWLCKHSSAIITCYCGDKSYFSEVSINNTPIYYIPWPTHPTIDPAMIKKIKGRGIYVGALTYNKNILEFKYTLPKILEDTPTKEFLIVGSGTYQHVIDHLKKLYPDEIKHIPSLPREKVLKLIASSYYAYTPVQYGGWGFFGDCWSMKTPIIATHNDYELKNREDCMVTIPQRNIHAINELYNNPQLYKKIQNEGYARFLKYHKAEIVGEKYYEIVKSVLNK